ncbi:hypothetical protein [Deinococcus petrolearius]|uniref:Uncharacterized protein n=1 Tax=Deinococcus petrolearius TaxID=1751295 RepID=A0ABW1DF83_9DEIO
MPKIDIENPRITFARLTVTVGSTEILLRSISYSDSMERGDIEGNARMSLGVTDGMYRTDEGEIEVYADEFAVLMDAFGDGFYEKSFDVSVAYEKIGSSTLTKDEVIGCRWTKRSSSNETGPDALTRSLSYKPLYIRWNGKNPLSKMPDGAK